MFVRLLAFLTVWFFSLPALADEPQAIGAPALWGMNFQPAFSPVKERMHEFHDLLLVIITCIALFVMLLLAYVILRYNSKANPVPRQFAHNTTIEIIWTAIPVLILVVISIPSFKLLYYVNKAPHPEMTLKVTGHQWYWSYEYPDQKIESFDSRPIWDGTPQKPEAIESALKDAQAGWIYNNQPLRLLEVDNRVVLPVDTQVRVYVNGADVVHSWGIPSLGVKMDAVPGHLNETWVQINKEGVYYGQCSQLCGTGHGFMPIVIEAVSKDRFAQWVASKTAPTTPAPGTKNKTSSAARSRIQ